MKDSIIRTIINELLVLNIVIEKTIFQRNDKRVNLRSKVEQMFVPYFPYITTVQMITILTNIRAFSFTIIIKLWGLKDRL